MTTERSQATETHSRPFLSVKWKTLIIISWVFFTAVSIVGYIIYTQGSRLFEEQLAETLQNNSSALLAENKRKLIEIGTSISLLRDDAASEEPEKTLIQYLDNNWDMLELEWALESLVIYDVSSKTPQSWGQKNSIVIDSLEKDGFKKIPSTQIICLDQCVIYAKIPMFYMNGQRKYLIIGSGLVDFIINFAQKNDLKAALLRRNFQKGSENLVSIEQWDAEIIGMTERANYRPIIRQLAEQVSFEELRGGGQTIRTPGDDFYYMHAVPLLETRKLEEGNHFLLLANDISSEKKRVYEAILSIGVVTCFGLLAAICLTFYVLNDSIHRIQRQASLLPLLAQKKFEEVRKQTAKHKKKIGSHETNWMC